MIPATETVTVPVETRSRKKLVMPLAIVGILIAVFIIGGITNEVFLTASNLLVIIRSAAIVGIVALGATFITISGRFFSLALGQTAVFSAVIFAVSLRAGMPFGVALLLTVLLAVIWGILQGGVVSLGGNPIITTLGASALMAALSGLMTDGKNIRIFDEATAWLGSARPLGIPTQTIAFVLLILVAIFIMRFTRLGRATILVGSNEATAAAAGVSVWRVTIAAFVLASITASIAGVFAAAQFEQARISEFVALDFDVVAAVLIGGTAIQGGKGSPFRAALGAIFIAIIQNYMLLMGVPYGVRTAIFGAIVLLAVVGFHYVGRRSGGAS